MSVRGQSEQNAYNYKIGIAVFKKTTGEKKKKYAQHIISADQVVFKNHEIPENK